MKAGDEAGEGTLGSADSIALMQQCAEQETDPDHRQKRRRKHFYNARLSPVMDRFSAIESRKVRCSRPT